MAVRAGRYRERMEVRRSSGERNQFGGATDATTLVQKPWCKVRHISDNENDGVQTVSQLILEFEIRYSKSLENPTSDMTIIYRSVSYDIISVINPYMLNEKLVILGKVR